MRCPKGYPIIAITPKAPSPGTPGEGWGEGFYLSRRPLTPTLSPEYRGEGALQLASDSLRLLAAPPRVNSMSDATETAPHAAVFQSPPSPLAPVALPVALLLFVAATHFLVDTVAGLLNPLWPALEKHYTLQGGAIFWMYSLWTLSTSISQLFFGYLGDRIHSRWLIWLGPGAAVVCLGCVGVTQSPWVLAALLAISGLGIAAFHPEAAALAGNCAPDHRSRSMSIFSMGGFLGQAVGPVASGWVVDHYGLSGLTGEIAIGLLALAVLWIGLRGASSRTTQTHVPSLPLREVFSGRIGTTLLLLTIGALRVVGAAGVPLALAYLLTARHRPYAEIGGSQSAFMFGIGAGGLACALFVGKKHEQLTLWLLPLIVAPVILAMPLMDGVVLLAAAGVAGLLIGVGLPVLISYGQQLLPGSQRVASSITMGVSWGTGGAIVAGIMAVCEARQTLEAAFAIFAAAVVLSCVLCYWLPTPREV